MNVRLKPPQWTVFNSQERFRVLVAGRRFGKTHLALVELCQAAWAPGRKAWYVAPTYRQAKHIAWNRLKQLTRPYWASKPNETDLQIQLQSGGTICLRGADNYDSLRGDGLDFIVLDEYASMRREAWTEVLRPALADRQGKALFIGTPKGFNHFYELYNEVERRPGWARFRFTTEEGANVSAEELAGAAQELNERVYQQEFCASFENLIAGRAYYAFDRDEDVKQVQYNPQLPLSWTIDFNIDPACSLLCQIIPVDTRIDAARRATLGDVGPRVHVLDEIVLSNTSTYDACRMFQKRTQKWLDALDDHFRIQVNYYGDATGDGRRSSASRTDWQIVREFFASNSGDYQAAAHVPSSNPEIKDRINCVNAVICNAQRQRRLTVSVNCRQLIQDLEQVSWKTDSNGNPTGDLDHSDPMRTHLSDALGYLLYRQFPMRPKIGYSTSKHL